MSAFWPGPERLNQLMSTLMEEFDGFKGNVNIHNSSKRASFTEVFIAVGGFFNYILAGITNLFTYHNMEKIKEDQSTLIHHMNALEHDLEVVESNQIILKNSIEEVRDYVHLESLAHKYEDRIQHNIDILRDDWTGET